MINQKKIQDVLLSVSMFFVTISYSSYSQNHGLVNVKYLGIGIMLYYLLLKKTVFTRKIDKKSGAIFFFLSIYFGSVNAIQYMSLSAAIIAVVYTLLLLSMIFCSYRLIVDYKDILSVGFGVLGGILFAVLTSSDAFVMKGYGRLRAYGGFIHPNTFGASAMICFVCFALVFVQFLNLKNKIKRNIHLVVLVNLLAMMVYFVELSASRNARYTIIIFTILLVVMKVSEKTKLPRWLNLLTGLVILSLIIVMIINEINKNGIEAMENRLESLSYINVDNFIELLFGNGLIGQSENLLAGSEFALTTMLGKVGILGSIVYTFLLYRIFMRGKGCANRGLFLPVYLAFIVSCVAEAYVTNITNIYSIVMWLLIGSLSDKYIPIDGSDYFYNSNKNESEISVL